MKDNPSRYVVQDPNGTWRSYVDGKLVGGGLPRKVDAEDAAGLRGSRAR